MDFLPYAECIGGRRKLQGGELGAPAPSRVTAKGQRGSIPASPFLYKTRSLRAEEETRGLTRVRRPLAQAQARPLQSLSITQVSDHTCPSSHRRSPSWRVRAQKIRSHVIIHAASSIRPTFRRPRPQAPQPARLTTWTRRLRSVSAIQARAPLARTFTNRARPISMKLCRPGCIDEAVVNSRSPTL